MSFKINVSRTIIFFIIVLLGVSISSSLVSAVTNSNNLTEEELLIYSKNDIIFTAPCGPAGGGSSECGISVSGDTIEEKIWNGLTSFMTDEQAAGVMGNMVGAESGGNPARHEGSFLNDDPSFPIATDTETSYGIGLAQWSYKRRVDLYNFLKEHNAENLWTEYIDEGRETYGNLSGADFLKKADENDVDTLIALELCYLKKEIEDDSSGEGYGKIMKETTVASAANTFMRTFEKPADMDAKQSGREEKAQKYYDQLHSGSSTNSNSASTDSSTDSDSSDTSSPSSSSSSSDPSCNGSEKGSMNINATAVALAWPLGTEESVWRYKQANGITGRPAYDGAASKWTSGRATDAFNKAFDEVYPNHKGWKQCPSIGASCDVGTGVIVRYSGVDDKFPRGLGGVMSHVEKHPEIWEVVNGSDTTPQAGDVVFQGGHIQITAQDEKGEFRIIESALCNKFWRVDAKITKYGAKDKKILRAKNANNSNVGVDFKKGVSTSSVTGAISSTGQGNKDIGASALELAWPEGTPKDTYQKKATDKFAEYYDTTDKANESGCIAGGKSCDRFVAAVVRYAGVDNNMDWGDVPTQLKYLTDSPDWEEITDVTTPKQIDDLESGDVIIVNGGKHIAIYAKDSSGKGHIVHASECERFGTTFGANGLDYASSIRVFRNKNNKSGGGATCNPCPTDGDDGGGGGSLKEGGMTKEEAKKFMEAYAKEADKKKTGSYEFDGAFIYDADCPNGTLNNCVAFSQWFFNKYTTKGPKWSNTTNGVGLAKKIAGDFSLKTGSGLNLQPYSIFSKSGPSDAGHTGVILGVDKKKKKVITGEAACNESSGAYTRPWIGEYSFDQVRSWNYVYLDKILKSGGVPTDD